MTFHGCHDRAPFADVALVQKGWSTDGRRSMLEVPFTMAKDCQYVKSELGKADPQCSGCRWKGQGNAA
jgi:hypothetical protein